MSDDEFFLVVDDNRPLLLDYTASSRTKCYQGKKKFHDKKKSNINEGANVFTLSRNGSHNFGHTHPGASQTICQNRGCTWTPDNNDQTHTVPWCYFPTNTGYVQSSMPSTNGGVTTIKLQKSTQSPGNPFGSDFENLNFQYQEIGAGLRVTISPDGISRYRPLVDINTTPNLVSSEKLQVNPQNNSIFSFKITRQSTGASVWDTNIGGLLFADKYIQIATYLPTDKIYGFGEQVHLTLKLCRYGYASLADMQAAMNRTISNGIPIDVAYADIDYMQRYKDFTYDSNLQFDGMWIDMNEPSNFGTNQDNPWYYNDPDHPKDEPLKCPTTGNDGALDVPPYQTTNVYQWGNGNYLCTNTLCMLAVTNNGTNNFYDTKCLYGWSEARATYNALRNATGKRGAVIGRSTFPSSGRYSGHWLGDNTARWDDLRTSIIGAQEFNLFGIPYVGSDVCGFIGTSNEELCLRWQQMGAFHSFFRNHNTKGAPPQDPGMWPSVAAAARKSNLWRYRHLPYLFSLHFLASLNGGTVIRPVFFEFWQDTDTYGLSYEFMWGPAILVMPVTNQGDTSVNGYLPIGAKWYSLYDYFYGTSMSNGRFDYPAPTEYLIPVFVRAGYIIPRQKPDVTTVATRLNEFQLLVALANGSDSNTFVSSGELYWDDGDTIVDDFSTHNYHHILYSFTVNKASATLNITKAKTATGLSLPSLDNIEIFGYPYQPNLKTATLNGNPLTINTATSSYSAFTQVLNITTSNLIDLNMNSQTLLVTWQNLATGRYWKKLQEEGGNEIY
uniref:P-type domain-containing protein n=1 Tax=Acrobeloides nanus TaxID=290746 RepID=A0A914ECA2_9BILA